MLTVCFVFVSACNCSEHGSCDTGRKGTGACFCEAGWTGERCETQQGEFTDARPISSQQETNRMKTHKITNIKFCV